MPPTIDLYLAIMLVALAVIPMNTLSQMFTAYLGAKLGVKPQDIRKYDDAVKNGENDEDAN